MGDLVPFRRRPVRRPRRPVRDLLWRELVGQVLRDARIERGETQRTVAERAGVSVQYLSEIERGRKDPSSEMLAAVGGAVGLPLLDLTTAVGRELTKITSQPTGPVALAA